MYIIKNREIIKVKFIEFNDGVCRVYDNRSRRSYSISSSNITNTRQEAELMMREYEIKKSFKKASKVNNKHTCSWCGRQGSSLTLDHITPLNHFGGKKEIRKNIEVWEKAWHVSNLQILCEECNKNKDNFVNENGDNLSLDSIDYSARVLNNKKTLKQSVHKNSPATKISYGMSTGKWEEADLSLLEYVAKADSNRLRLDTILSSTEVYDGLPKTI